MADEKVDDTGADTTAGTDTTDDKADDKTSTDAALTGGDKVDTSKTDGDKAGDKVGDKADDKTDAGKGAAPVEYKLSLPKDSLLDASRVDEIVSDAKERGLSNEAAQENLNRESGAVARFQEAQSEEVEGIRKDWVEETKADKEIGGEKLKETQELAQRVFTRFGNEALKDIFEETGFGDHPEWVRFVSRIGKAMADDQLEMPGSQAKGGKKSAEELLYPSTTKK